MEKRFGLACLLLWLAACSRRPEPPPVTPEPTAPAETPRPSRPLQVDPLPKPDLKSPTLPKPALPSLHPSLDKPGLDLPLLPHRPSWTGPYWDSRFDHWHYPDYKPQPVPQLDWKLDLEFTRTQQQDPFSNLHIPVHNINNILDDIEREQQARKEDYPDFPIPLNLSIPY